MSTPAASLPSALAGRESMPDRQLRVLCVLFFFSGFPALIYQLVWQRALFRIFGVNIESVTIVVTAFMLGLGLGGLAGGCCGLRAALQLRFEGVDARLQRGHVGGRRGAEFLEGARHALLEDVLQLAPLARGLGAELAGEAGHALLGLGEGFFSGRLGLLLHAGAVLDQRLEGLAAFLLHLGEGPETGQPDLLRGILDAVGGLVVAVVVLSRHAK